MSKLAVVGSREWTDYERFSKEMQLYVNGFGIPGTIVSGGARGVDTMAARWAQEHKVELVEFKPEYDKYGRKNAPLMRNTQIVEACDRMLAITHPESRGTWDSIDKAQKANKPVTVVMWK